MILKRRTLMRWGFRAGTALAYFSDPDLGPQRREAVLATIAPYGAKTRLGPVITWLRSLNAGEISRPPTRAQMAAARAAAASGDGPLAAEEAPTGEEVLDPDADADHGDAEERLTVVEHHHN